MINLLERYLLVNFFKNWLTVLIVLMGVYYAVSILELALRIEVSLFVIIKYFLYLSTEIFMQISGIISVLAISLTMGQLQSKKELLVCQSLGKPLFSILKPIFLLSAALSLTFLVVLTYVNPILLKKAKRVYYEEVWKEKTPVLSLNSNKIWYESNNFIFNLQSVEKSEKSGKGLSLYKFSSQWHLDYFIQAKFVDFSSKSLWKLYDGKSYIEDKNQLVLVTPFLEKTISEPPKIKTFNFSVEFYKYMNSFQLYKFVKNNQNLGLDTVKYEIEYYSRFLLSFSSLLLLLAFVPLSVGPLVNRFQTYKKSTLGIVFAALYWFIYTSSVKMALTLGNTFIIFIPALLLLLASILLWKRAKH
ncbi:MAG: YjgP/YjgQ family permease [Bdellovibrionaceae bacterium]|nr:YjgP/YjgQ family permease [Pseudobdellovibrionaceae bacterium]